LTGSSIARDVDDRIRGGERIGRAEVAHELARDCATSTGSSDSTRSCKRCVVARSRIAPAAQLRERDRALGEALEDQVVELASLREIDRRIEAIAREARTAAESTRFR
jgi:hypothetical protein